MRTDQEEATLLWVNLPTVGVVTSLKKDYILQLVTGLLTAKPANSICVVLQANRAAESKKRRGWGFQNLSPDLLMILEPYFLKCQ